MVSIVIVSSKELIAKSKEIWWSDILLVAVLQFQHPARFSLALQLAVLDARPVLCTSGSVIAIFAAVNDCVSYLLEAEKKGQWLGKWAILGLSSFHEMDLNINFC